MAFRFCWVKCMRNWNWLLARSSSLNRGVTFWGQGRKNMISSRFVAYFFLPFSANPFLWSCRETFAWKIVTNELVWFQKMVQSVLIPCILNMLLARCDLFSRRITCIYLHCCSESALRRHLKVPTKLFKTLFKWTTVCDNVIVRS